MIFPFTQMIIEFDSKRVVRGKPITHSPVSVTKLIQEIADVHLWDIKTFGVEKMTICSIQVENSPFEFDCTAIYLKYLSMNRPDIIKQYAEKFGEKKPLKGE